MGVTTAPILAAALLLAVAGVGKLAQPASTVTALRAASIPGGTMAVQFLAIFEMVVAVATLIWATPLTVAALAVCYAGFAGFTWRLWRKQGAAASCGCFGARTTPVHQIHIWLNVAVAAVVCAGLVWPPSDMGTIPGTPPLAGVPLLVMTVTIAGCLYLALTLLPELLTQAATSPSVE